MSLEIFHPLIQQWFADRFGKPTDPQRLGWPAIAAGQNTLIAAPTGSGKTLSAFLVCLDRLLRQWLDGRLEDGIQVVYVSPLKALSNDIERNLQTPLAEIGRIVEAAGLGTPAIRVAVRTGDTPAGQRQQMLRLPPHILVTTPESLYLLLTSEKSRKRLATVHTVIVDEIHALARDKRGSHLTLTLERLAEFTGKPLTRIGLSATQRPMDEIANFLVGVARETPAAPPNDTPNRATPVAASTPPRSRQLAIAFSDEADDGGGRQSDGQECPSYDQLRRTDGQECPSHDQHHDQHHPQHHDGKTPQDCVIVDVGHIRDLDLALEVPPSELAAVCSNEQWGEVYERLVELVNSHRSTLIFVNTRRMAERLAYRLTELLGEEAVASHHGSLSREIRLSAEQRLKAGKLKAIVATASLEMGIDIGYIDLVCQIGSPRAIATFLQRVGRSGHSIGATPKGRLFPLTRDELLECMALVRAVRLRELDRIEIPSEPLDILAQQIVAAVACQEYDEDALFALCTRAWPFRNLDRHEFDEVLKILSEGIMPQMKRGAYLHRDQIHKRLRARKGARLAAITSGGAIPETAQYRVLAEPDGTFVGSVDEDFAIESMAGDVFLLGNTSWRIRAVRGGEVHVADAEGAPPSIPFWFGEAPGRTIELSEQISTLRREIAARVTTVPASITSQSITSQSITSPPNGLTVPAANSTPATTSPATTSPATTSPATTSPASTVLATKTLASVTLASVTLAPDPSRAALFQWLQQETGANEWAASQAVRYIEAQLAAIGLVPTTTEIVYERFFDESGGMQLVIHAPLGARINRAWGLAMRKRFCRSFDFELQAAATDNGIVLSLSPQHSFPIEQLFKMLGPHNGQDLLQQALLAVPMFQVRWRWNVSRSLAVLRFQGGKKVPFFLQRYRSDDLLAATFPETVGCLENHHGDIEIPDHPLVRQTMKDCLHEAMDLDRWLAVLRSAQKGDVQLIPRDTREPSPFSHELINANPYAFLDGAALEERRTRAVTTRRSLNPDDFRDLTRLDPDAIAQVAAEAWPVVRDAEELHDALMNLGVVLPDEGRAWSDWFDALVRAGRATTVTIGGGGGGAVPAPAGRRTFWIAAERWPLLRAIHADAAVWPAVELPEELDKPIERSVAWVELVKGRMQYAGPIAVARLAELLAIDESFVQTSLEALEGQGLVLRGSFVAGPGDGQGDGQSEGQDDGPVGWPIVPLDPKKHVTGNDWCDRRLLARIHRLTLDGLRRKIQPVSPADYLLFLIRHQRLDGELQWAGAVGVREALGQLQGFEMPAGAWESQVLSARVSDYDPHWLDHLFLAGEAMWGRLHPPQRDESDGPSMAALTRTVPISLLLREDLAWLLPDERPNVDGFARGNAQQVLEALSARGALFFNELKLATGLLPTHLEEALRELAALGLITSDAFAAVRTIVAEKSKASASRYRSFGSPSGLSAPAGRWSRFPGAAVGPVAPPKNGEAKNGEAPNGKAKNADARNEDARRAASAASAAAAVRAHHWCELLLRRYGVVFRDVLARETAAPPWQQLVSVLRRMELRGEVRGGRFVTGVSGEQYGTEAAVVQLRQIRDALSAEKRDAWLVISAADPLNLSGLVVEGPRVPATHKNSLILQGGRCVAMKRGGEIEFFAQFDEPTQQAMRRALVQGRRREPELHAPLRKV